MEFNLPPYLLQAAKCKLELNSSADCGYFSACGSLSPSSSIDSGCFSPPWGAGRQLEGLENASVDCLQAKKLKLALPVDSKRRSRSKNPGMKRQSASEREKLRMRDLTKALHHLRAFLPPSVAPAGQTLTKIETLRLAISYISHLSDQLGQAEVPNYEMCCSAEASDRLQSGLIFENLCMDGQQGLMQDNVQYCPTLTSFGDSREQMENSFPASSHFRDAQSYMFPCTTMDDASYSHQFYQ
ncbi:mesoderm posterior ab [Danio aesculapii]|uniref:mesoderm posterior ab n=1 Tax=Danio aesculapii TaxID=1142201 RepID=UPI0024BFE4C0|nr:mesoderm posterior ab [Danio aesculapii]